MEAARSSRTANLVPWALAILFVALTVPGLDTELRNFDEGVYILQARQVREGQLPYAAFFYQQPPLYLYALAGFSRLAPDSLLAHRLLSVLATAAAGAVLVDAARRFAPLPAAAAAALFFYFAPLQHFGVLALPNGLMVALAVLGVYGTVFREQSRWVVAGALCLVMAILVKPLSLPTLLAVGLVVLLVPEQRWKLRPLLAAVGATGAAAWLLLHLATDGSFSDVLLLQAFRYREGGGFELMTHIPAFRGALLERGVSTALGWNLSEHARAFLAPGPGILNLALALLALVGGAALRRASPAPPRHVVLVLVLWVALPASFSLFVWSPIWDHYFVQYLPPLSLLATSAVAFLWQRRRLTLPARAAAAVLVGTYALAGLELPTGDPRFYESAARLARERRPLLTFDPLLNFLSGTAPGCDLIDPLNVYGAHSLSALSPNGPLARFNVSTEALVRCLHRSPELAVVVSPMLAWFLDAQLARALGELDPARVLYLTPADRALLERFQASDPVAPAP